MGQGINFNVTDTKRYFGNGLLHAMVAHDLSDRAQKFIELLIGPGCISKLNFDKQDTSDRTALHLLVARKYFTGTHEKLIDPLLRMGTDVSIVDKKGNNLLHIAFAKRDIKTIISLKQYPELQKCLTVENKEGKSPLDYLEEDVLYDDISQEMLSIYPDS